MFKGSIMIHVIGVVGEVFLVFCAHLKLFAGRVLVERFSVNVVGHPFQVAILEEVIDAFIGPVQPLQVLVCTTDTKIGDVFFERDVVICMWACREMAQQ